MTDEWKIERLAKHHDRRHFDCGQSILSDWLRNSAGQFDRRDLARTFVAVQDRTTDVLGYYALANHRITIEALPNKESKQLPRIAVPVILLGRLAVDRSMQGKGLGSFLLLDALRRCCSIAEHVGMRAVEVHAIDDNAKSFYIKHGFIELLDDPQHLFLPIQIIRKLNLPPLH